MKLSIIIPVYNEERFLKRCLDSVSAQATNGVEVIIIDDGSTDNSKNIAYGYFDDGFQIKAHLTNWGVSIARNDGLNMATGEYVTFLDSDDELAPGAIDNMLDAVDRYKERPVIQYNHLRVLDENEKPVLRHVNPRGYYDLFKRPNRWQVVWNKIYKREFLNENGIRFVPHLQFGEDEIFNLECMATGATIYNIEDVTVIKHFDNEESICHTLGEKKILKQNMALCDFIAQHEEPNVKAAVREIMAEHWNSNAYKKVFAKIESK